MRSSSVRPSLVLPSLALALATGVVVVACAAHEVSVEPTPVCAEGMTLVDGGRFGQTEITPLCFDITEVTTAAYGTCVDEGACSPALGQRDEACNIVQAGRAEHPINCVNAVQAAAYCEWVGKRLPTGSEWGWAARGRSRGTQYPWGDAPVDDVRACWRRGDAGTCEVGSRPAGASPDGVLDLAGNVTEWTVARSDVPLAPERSELRGGSWMDDASTVTRFSERVADDVPIPVSTAGFRCVTDPHATVRTVDTQSWTPHEVAPPKPEPPRELPVVAPRPTMPKAGRPLENLAPLWHHVDGDGDRADQMWPIGQEYGAIDRASARRLALKGGVNLAARPGALGDFYPVAPAGSLVLMAKGSATSGHFVMVERDSFAIRWQVDLGSLGRAYNYAVTPKALVVGMYGRDADVVVALGLVDGRELWRKVGGDGGEFKRVQTLWTDKGRAYLVGDRGLSAFDPITGAALWGPVSIASGCGVTSGGGVVVIEDPSAGHRVIDAATGALQRRIQTRGTGECVWDGYTYDGGVAGAAIAGGRLFVLEPPAGKRQPTLRAFELASGRDLWRRKNVGSSVLVASGDAVFVERRGSILMALDATTGAPQTEISTGYDIADVTVVAGGGAAGPLVAVTDDENGLWLLGRQETKPEPEAYTVRGRLVPDPDSDLKRRWVARQPVRVADRRTRTSSSGRFSARGKTLGAVAVTFDGPTEYEDFEDEPYSRTLVRFDRMLVVLTGKGTYDVGDINLYEWWLE